MAAFFYPEMAILTSGRASRAYRTLRGAFLISENGITHFGSSKSLDRHMAASSISKWQYSLRGASRLVDTMRLLLS